MSDPRRNRFKTYAGIIVSALLATLAGWVLWRTFQRISFADVLAQMQAVPASTLALALSPPRLCTVHPDSCALVRQRVFCGWPVITGSCGRATSLRCRYS